MVEDEVSTILVDNCEILEENDKISFLTSYIIDSIREGGSVMIPIGRLGIILQLLEQISDMLKSLSLEVPINCCLSPSLIFGLTSLYIGHDRYVSILFVLLMVMLGLL